MVKEDHTGSKLERRLSRDPGGHKTDHGGHKTDHGAHKLEHGAHKPEHGAHKPEHGAHKAGAHGRRMSVIGKDGRKSVKFSKKCELAD